MVLGMCSASGLAMDPLIIFKEKYILHVKLVWGQGPPKYIYRMDDRMDGWAYKHSQNRWSNLQSKYRNVHYCCFLMDTLHRSGLPIRG